MFSTKPYIKALILFSIILLDKPVYAALNTIEMINEKRLSPENSLLFSFQKSDPVFAKKKEHSTLTGNERNSVEEMRKKWVFGFMYMYMDMKGNLNRTRDLSSSEIFRQGFNVTALNMTMNVFKLSAMYKASDWVFLRASIPYVINSMDHLTKAGINFTTSSNGIGDLLVNGVITIYKKPQQKIFLEAGLSFPTGSINKKDNTPSVKNQYLPYPMQIGSGTYDTLLGLVYKGKRKAWFWEVNNQGIIRIGRNQKGYAKGNQIQISPSFGYNLIHGVSLFTGINGLMWGNVRGSASGLSPSTFPQANPNFQGGARIDLCLGMELFGGKKMLKNQRLKLAFYIPFYQNLDGPQLKTKWQMNVFWTIAPF